MATQKVRNTITLYSQEDKCKCKSAVSRLLKEQVISLDAEGVQLGKDGPLTLLQIGTLDGDVYLFDVMINEKKQDKMFFKDTTLDTILTSATIVKVIQSCSGDSAALYHQFGIRLENVFDTQVAHLVIEEHKGKRLPTREKLAEICKLYSENAEVYEGKDDVKLEWSKIAGNYWAKRPMTQTMIDYASGDVTSLIPEVYETQKEYITRNQLLDLYEERVLEEIELNIEPTAKENRKTRNFNIRMDIIEDMAKKYRQGTVYESITDKDEIKALQDTNFSELAEHNSIITELKQQSMASYLKSLEEKLETPEEFIPDRGVNFKLNEIERFGSEHLKKDALRIKGKVEDVICSDVQRKYKADEPLEILSSTEYQIIQNLKPIGDNAPNYQPTVVALHWKIAATEMQAATDALKDDPDYNMTIPVPQLKFFTNNTNVPGNVKRIAQDLLEKNESAILRRIPRKYTINSQLSDLTTSEKMVLEHLKIKALQDTNFSELAEHNSVITELKQQSMASYLKSLEEQLETPEEFIPDRGVNFKLNEIERFGSEHLKKDALRIKGKVEDVICSDVQRKYKADEPLENLSSTEYQMIQNLKPIGDNAPNYQPTVVALHWKIAATEMQDATDALKDDPDYNMTIPVPKLKFFTNNTNVPGNVKRIAQELLEKNESAILRSIPRKYTINSQLSDLTTSEKIVLEHLKIKALQDTNFSELAEHNSVITELKQQSMASYLKSLEEQLETPEEFIPDRGVNFKLNEIERFGSEHLKKDALRIKGKVEDVICSDVQRKYKADEPLENLSSTEYQIIQNLKPIGDNAPNYQPTVVALHWKIVATEMQDATDALDDDPNFNMTYPIPKLNFLTKNTNVPGNVKRIAQELQEKHESAILRIIPRKYTKNSQLSDLTTSEKMVLEHLKISSQSYDPVVVDLHWKNNVEKLEKDIADFRAGNLIVNDGLRRKLDFFQKNESVPVEVKQKASEFLQLLL